MSTTAVPPPTGGPIVVGVDGSPFAAAALAWAADLARAIDAEVVAVHAFGLLAHLHAGAESAEQHRAEVEDALRSRWVAPLAGAGVRYRTVLAEGNPVTALLQVADETRARMVVVGCRGTGGFPGLQLGSTSHQLAQHATTPVVIVPAPDGAVADRR